ncbi:MAG: apolipoprotein N-acyltransferase [candidate division Zixibacteria bacterium]|nr:apolipoprotein N-acyltransferase [candidate division Zixibacteria bacterium]
MKRNLKLVLLSAFLTSLSFPPLPLGFLAYFCLVPLILAWQDKTPKQAFGLGYLFGVISNLLLLYWIAWPISLGYYILFLAASAAILILSLYPAILALLYALIERRWKDKAVFALPFLWVSMEYLRSLGEVAFPWVNLAYTQTKYLDLIQYASITGIYGVSFWVVCLNVILFFYVKSYLSRRKLIGITLIFLGFMILPYLYGHLSLNQQVKKDGPRIALLQGNIDIQTKWDPDLVDYNLETYFEMSRDAALKTHNSCKQKVDLIIWPETAAPCYLAHEWKYLNWVKREVDSLDIPMLIGAQHYRREGENYNYYNSAFFFKPHRRDFEIYDKINMVPFSERIPYREKLGPINNLQLGQSDFSRGKDFTIFNLPQGNFAVLICFESAFPDLVRKFVNCGASFLVNITNDAWFGKTSGPFQHSQMAVLRAIENRIGIARCGNTGVSMFIDPYGRTSQVTPIWTKKIIIENVALQKKKTFYTKYGDWLAKLCCLVTLVALGSSFVLRRVSER